MSNLKKVSETWVKDGHELVAEYVTGFGDPHVQFEQDMHKMGVELQLTVNGWTRKEPPHPNATKEETK